MLSSPLRKGMTTMSRGPGRLQKLILDYLAGRRSGPVYGGGSLTTAELVANLTEAGLMPERGAAKHLHRAAMSLWRRGLAHADRLAWDDEARCYSRTWHHGPAPQREEI